MVNVGSLFTGIGGFDLGLERAGMRVVWQCEVDDYCRRVLAQHWPDVPCYRDVRDLRSAGRQAVSPVDVLCGGFPCQDISVAGKGAGITGARSGLWAEYARLISELRPRYVIVENVPALLARGLDVVLGDLAAIGYDAEWDCLPASAFGAPHRRDRIWIVAYPAHPDADRRRREELREPQPARLEHQRNEPDGLRAAGPTSTMVDPQGDRRGTRRARGSAATGPGQPGPSGHWGTPTARDWKDTGDMTNVPTNGLLGRQVLQFPERTPTPTAGDAKTQDRGSATRTAGRRRVRAAARPAPAAASSGPTAEPRASNAANTACTYKPK